MGAYFAIVHEKQKKDDAEFIATIRKNPKNYTLLEDLFSHYDTKNVGKLESKFFVDSLVRANLV